MVGLQIFADAALLLSIIFLIWAVSRERKTTPPGVDAETLAEFKKLIEDSRRSSDHLFRALHEVKGLASALDAKEKRLMALAGEPDTRGGSQKSGNPDRGGKYRDVVKMAAQGLDAKAIADTLRLPEGEISLILDLNRRKNENSTHRTHTP